jgi:hypothetical protein
MNEILVLKRTEPEEDGMIFSCYNGVTRQDGPESKAEFWEGSRANYFIRSFLRKVNKSVDEYGSTEEVIRDFLRYCKDVKIIGE